MRFDYSAEPMSLWRILEKSLATVVPFSRNISGAENERVELKTLGFHHSLERHSHAMLRKQSADRTSGGFLMY